MKNKGRREGKIEERRRKKGKRKEESKDFREEIDQY